MECVWKKQLCVEQKKIAEAMGKDAMRLLHMWSVTISWSVTAETVDAGDVNKHVDGVTDHVGGVFKLLD